MTRIRIFSWLVALVVPFGGSPAIQAQCDGAAPQLVDFDFNPKSVDVTGGDQLVTLTFDVTDDVSGVDLVGVTLLSPSTVQTVKCNSDVPLSGTPVNGTYQCTATMPEFSESGTWVIDQISKSDRVTRSDSVFTDDLMLLGLPFELQVSSIPDVSPPVLTGFSVSTVAVDTSAGPAQVSCDISATDDLAGISLVFCQLTAPSQVGRTGCTALVPSSGTPTNGLFSCTMEVPRYSETDDWELSVELLDAVDNGIKYTPQDLAMSGFPDLVAVTSTPEDLLPPVLLDFDLQPVQVNVEQADRIVTCTAHLTDALAGNAIFGCSGTFIDGAFNIITQACSALTPDSGTVHDGIWSCDLTIPQYSPGGTWGFVTAVFIDAVGNSAFADSTILQTRGFPSAFDVICNNSGPGPGPLVNWLNGLILSWTPVAGATEYKLYGGPLSLLSDLDANGLPDAGYGFCRNAEDSDTTDTLFVDAVAPPPGGGSFLLVGYDTASLQNLGLGTSSAGLSRAPTAPCP